MKRIYTILKFLMLFLVAHNTSAQDFITQWNLSFPGSGPTQITFGTATSGLVNYTWQEISPGSAAGSGSWSGASLTITGLPAGATIRLQISPANFERIIVAFGPDRERLTSVEAWGSSNWTSMAAAFWGCSNLQVLATDVPNLSGVNDLSYMFSECTNLNSPTNIGSWNTASVITMSNMFDRATQFNQNISSWNTGSVTNMNSMFFGANSFNQNIGAWNVASVTIMAAMFADATSFNQDIGPWNTSAVSTMAEMFAGATSFNINIGSWNTAAVTDMSAMFYNASAFNNGGSTSIGNWNTSSVQNMGGMFSGANSFDQNIGSWNTAAVSNLAGMFYAAFAFNNGGSGSINNWNTTSVTNMIQTFFNATAFNQNIGSWNTSAVTDMSNMFSFASAFNNGGSDAINNWNTSAVTSMFEMFAGASSFDQNIGSWNTGAVQDMSKMFFLASSFNNGGNASINNWNTSAVRNMSRMFHQAVVFNQNIGSWNTASVIDMSGMFLLAIAFTNGGSNSINNWSTSSVTNMRAMFQQAISFNQNIGSWNTSSVLDMSYMFLDANIFNQNISAWSTAAVKNFSFMFYNAHAFNQNIDSWNTEAVTDMSHMFERAWAFDQNIGAWNTASVIDMRHMLNGAISFNRSLGSWSLNSGVNLSNLLDNCGLDCNNYSATLIGWSANPSTPNGRTLGATGRQYGTNAAAARTNLTTTKGWTIVGDSPSGTFCAVVSVPNITSFTPTSGPIGTTVVIAGTNFDPVAASNTVSFNGVTATTPSAASATSLTVTVPVGSTTGPISVTTLAGTGTSSTNFVVTCLPPLPPLSNPVSRCGTGTITLTASGATGTQEYRWYDVSTGGTSIASTASFTAPSLSVTTPFYVSILEVATSCESARISVNAIVNTPPAAPAPINNSGCSGTSIILGASGGSPGLYRWYTVPTAGTADATQQNNAFTTPLLTITTSYWVAVTDGTCESTRAEAVATVIPLPNAPGITPVNPVCPGSTVTVTASGTTNGNYRWYEGGTLLPGEVNALLTVSNIIGNRTLSVAISNGPCESSRTNVLISLKNCTPPVIAPSTTTAFIEGTVTINLCELISDAENDLDASSIQAVGTLTSSAPFTLIGCTLTINYGGVPFPGTDVLMIRACDQTGLCTDQSVSIELGGEITVYNAISPNGDGKNDRFYIQYIDILPETRQNRVTIFNRWGDVVWSADNYNNTAVAFTGVSNNGKDLPTGTYYYTLEFANGEKRNGFISLKR